MAEYLANPSPAFPPPHAGEILQELIELNGKSISEIARMLNVSRQHLHGIIAGKKSVSPEMAAKLGKLFGNGAGIWLRMQAKFDTWHAEREVDTSGIEVICT